jgi:hypothetical protein
LRGNDKKKITRSGLSYFLTNIRITDAIFTGKEGRGWILVRRLDKNFFPFPFALW